MSATGAVALNVQMEAERRNTLAAQNQHRADMNQGALRSMGEALGRMHQEKQLMAAGRARLVGLGASPAEADQVLATKNPQIIGQFMQQLQANKRIQNSIAMLGMNGAAAPVGTPQDAGGAMIPWPSSPAADPSMTAPPSSEPVMDGSVPPPDASTPGIVAPPRPQTSTVGGVPMTSSPAARGFPNTDPNAFPSRRQLLANFAAGQGGGDAGALHDALGFLPPEVTERDRLAMERDRVGMERDRFEIGRPREYVPTDEAAYMRAHPPTTHEPRVTPGDDVPIPDDLAAQLETKYGVPPGTFKGKTPRQIGLTPNPQHPSAAPKTTDQIREEAKARAEGANAGGGDPLRNDINKLALAVGQRNAAEHESPAHKIERENADKEYERVLAFGKSPEKLSLYTSTTDGARGREAYARDVAAAKAAKAKLDGELNTGDTTFPMAPKAAAPGIDLPPVPKAGAPNATPPVAPPVTPEPPAAPPVTPEPPAAPHPSGLPPEQVKKLLFNGYVWNGAGWVAPAAGAPK